MTERIVRPHEAADHGSPSKLAGLGMVEALQPKENPIYRLIQKECPADNPVVSAGMRKWAEQHHIPFDIPTSRVKVDGFIIGSLKTMGREWP